MDILAHFDDVSVAESVKRHIYMLRHVIWAYNHISITFRSKALARTSTSFEARFLGILANFRWPNLAKSVERHLTFCSKVLARTWKRSQKDGQTDEQTDTPTL